jgi:5,10-methylenetetrahydromethanopterin reductase
MYDTFPSYRAVLEREGVESGADLTLAGSADHILDGLNDYVTAGATDLRIVIPARTPDERLATKDFLVSLLDADS